MKIARILYAYSPYQFGGTDIYSEKISRALDERGNETVIITINPNKGEVLETEGRTKIYRFHPFNVSTVHNIGKKSTVIQGMWTIFDLYSFYSYNKIKTILKKEKPDIVHMHTPIDVTLSAVNAVKNLGYPLVYTLHDAFLLCRRFILLHGSGKICTDKTVNPLCKIYREFTKRIVDKVDLVIAPSQFVLDLHKKEGFFNNCKAVVLPHGIEVDSSKIVRDNSRLDKIKKNIDVFYMGGLTKHKGVHILINAFKQIKNNKVKLHIIGGGVYEEQLRLLAKGEDRIIFYGRYSYQDTQDFYKKADVVVVPSVCYDMRPNVIPESFRASVPVIGADIGGIPELIEDGYNGFLFESENIDQLKVVLEKAIEDPEKLMELGKNAREFVTQFEMSTYIDKLTNVYKETIEINKTRNLKLKNIRSF